MHMCNLIFANNGYYIPKLIVKDHVTNVSVQICEVAKDHVLFLSFICKFVMNCKCFQCCTHIHICIIQVLQTIGTTTTM